MLYYQYFKEFGDVSMIKGALKSIYSLVDNEFQAGAVFKNWYPFALQSEIKKLIDMAKTIENNLDVITVYWKTNALTNVSSMNSEAKNLKKLIFYENNQNLYHHW